MYTSSISHGNFKRTQKILYVCIYMELLAWIWIRNTDINIRAIVFIRAQYVLLLFISLLEIFSRKISY